MTIPGPESVQVAVGLLGLGSAAAAVWRRYVPRWRAKIKRRRDMEDAILGRAAEPDNKATGEKGRQALPALGERLDSIVETQHQQGEKLDQVHHQVFPNGGGSLRDDVVTVKRRLEDGSLHFTEHDAQLAEIREQLSILTTRTEHLEQLVGVELHASNEAVANAAQAAKHLLPVIDTALKSSPPDGLATVPGEQPGLD